MCDHTKSVNTCSVQVGTREGNKSLVLVKLKVFRLVCWSGRSPRNLPTLIFNNRDFSYSLIGVAEINVLDPLSRENIKRRTIIIRRGESVSNHQCLSKLHISSSLRICSCHLDLQLKSAQLLGC
jgi:hypothetical protein